MLIYTMKVNQNLNIIIQVIIKEENGPNQIEVTMKNNTVTKNIKIID